MYYITGKKKLKKQDKQPGKEVVDLENPKVSAQTQGFIFQSIWIVIVISTYL